MSKPNLYVFINKYALTLVSNYAAKLRLFGDACKFIDYQLVFHMPHLVLKNAAFTTSKGGVYSP